MLRIYIGFQAIKFYCFPPPRPLPPHFNCFPSTTATTFLFFSLHPHHHHHRQISIVFFPPPPPPHFYCFPSTTTTTTTTFLLIPLYHDYRHHISIVFLHHQNHLISSVFPPQDSIRDYQLPFLVHFVAMSRAVNNNRVLLQLLADCAAYQRQFLLKTATPQQLHAIVKDLYNILWHKFLSSKKIS